jgi:predicted esterase
MAKKLIVVAHGIGDAKEGFEAEWKKVIEKNNNLNDVEVRGLWWEDVLQQVAARYPIVSKNMAKLVAACGFDKLEEWVGSEKWSTLQDYMMDVFVYVGLDEMWIKIQDQCALKLEALRKNDSGVEVYAEQNTILVGHSLGAAMLPHLVWREYSATGTIPYRGMILLASPLAFETPYPDLCQDFLRRMAGMAGGTRENTLKLFARVWRKQGNNRLKLICNENDIVCSDVKYKIPATGSLVDLIPLRQGFNPSEISVMNRENEGCVQYISFGKRDPSKVVDNHDVIAYLKQPAFNEALSALL